MLQIETPIKVGTPKMAPDLRAPSTICIHFQNQSCTYTVDGTFKNKLLLLITFAYGIQILSSLVGWNMLSLANKTV